MREVEFNTGDGTRYLAYGDLGLFLTDVVISPPEPKRILVEVPGRDGYIDMTDSVGGIAYKNRKITLTFAIADYTYTWESVFSEVMAALHGRKYHVYIYPRLWYWDSFVTVSSMKNDRNRGTIVVECDAFPYKLLNMQFQHQMAGGSGVWIEEIDTGQLMEVPELITSPSSGTLNWQKTGSGTIIKSYSLVTGSNYFPDLVLTPEAHRIMIQTTSAGLFKMNYRKGVL